MVLDRSISLGNIISWVVLIVGLAAGFGKIKATTEQNALDVKEAKMLASEVNKALQASDAARNAQISALTVSVSEMKITTFYMDKKLDEVVQLARANK